MGRILKNSTQEALKIIDSICSQVQGFSSLLSLMLSRNVSDLQMMQMDPFKEWILRNNIF